MPISNKYNIENTAIAINGMTLIISFGDILDDVFSDENKTFSFSFWLMTENSPSDNDIILTKNADSNCGENEREFFIRILNGNIDVRYFGRGRIIYVSLFYIRLQFRFPHLY